MASKTQTFSRWYEDTFKDVDFSEELTSTNQICLFQNLTLSDDCGASGIHLIDLSVLEARLKIKKEYIRVFLSNPDSKLFAFNSSNNVIWLKKYFVDRTKILGLPHTFIGSIVNEYRATKNCSEFWKGWFLQNSVTLNEIYLKHFFSCFEEKKLADPLKKTKSEEKTERYEKECRDAINTLYSIRQSLFGEKFGDQIKF